MNKILKNIFLLLFSCLFFISKVVAASQSYTPIVDENEKIYDFADLFTDSEEETLLNEVKSFIDNYTLDMAIVTIDKNDKQSAMNYADDFYDYNNFGKNDTHDGLLFLIDMDTREIWISTTGTAQLIYNDYRINKILDDAFTEVSNEKYFNSAKKFISLSGIYANDGIPANNSEAYIDEDGNYLIEEDKFDSICFSVLIAAIVTFIFMFFALMQHRMIKKASQAKEYLKTINITDRKDSFLTTNTTSVYIASSSSSGSYRGGSSTHSGSSGRSHGGGGRRF